MSKTVSTTVAGPTRTILQGIPMEGLIQLSEAFGWTHLTEDQHAALLVVLTAVGSLIQNYIENRTGRGFLRRVPPRRVPIVDDSDPTPVKKAPAKKKTAKKTTAHVRKG